MSSRRPFVIVALALGFTALLGACSSDSKAAKPTEVKVELKEWEFKASQTSAPRGDVTFTATNNGKEFHELVLFKTDLAPEKMPVDEDGAVDEQGEGLVFIDEIEGVRPGQTKSFVAKDLKPGTYVMACNVIENGEKHFMHKMHAVFTVTD